MKRVWTHNSNGTVTCMTDWMTESKCRAFCKARWGNIPGFVAISSAKDEKSFRRSNKW